MEIEKLREQIHFLQTGRKSTQGTRDSQELLEENESLKESLQALQNEFDYYKD